MNYRYLSFLTGGHLCTDLNQGAVPALLPFLISEHGLSFSAAAGLVFAANATSSIAQPLFGHFSDRLSKPWLMPIGVFLAGLGVAMVGVANNYWLIFLAVSISGIGIAAFHPEAVRFANAVAGDKKATGISIFSVGGNAGFAVGPLLTAVLVMAWGLKGTLFLIIPVSIMAVALLSQIKSLVEYKIGRLRKWIVRRQVMTNGSHLPDYQWL